MFGTENLKIVQKSPTTLITNASKLHTNQKHKHNSISRVFVKYNLFRRGGVHSPSRPEYTNISQSFTQAENVMSKKLIFQI